MTNRAPHITNDFTPLQDLAERALVQYGDFAAGTQIGEAMPMFIQFANDIVDEVNMHPYAPADEIPYYVHAADKRPIRDAIMVSGLLAKFSTQQASEKAKVYVPAYNRTINIQLWQDLNGNTRIRARPVDGGSNLQTSLNTSRTNGYPTR